MLTDLRYAIRSLSRTPGFTLAVMLTLGLGIGANTAIFSVVRGVLLRPLPHRDGDRLVYLRQSINGPGGENIAFSVPEILDFRNGAKTLSGIAEYSQMTYTLQGRGRRRAHQRRPRDRQLLPGHGPVADPRPHAQRRRRRHRRAAGDGAHPRVLAARFGGDPAVIGKMVRVDGRNVEVVGVLQPAPTFPNRMDALMNMVISEHHTSAMMVQGRTHRMTEMIARLAPGATVEQARAEVATIRQHVQTEFPTRTIPGSATRSRSSRSRKCSASTRGSRSGCSWAPRRSS